MLFTPTASRLLVHAATLPDTIVARMVADRGVLDWTSGILQLVVLLLGVATLATMVALLVTVRRGVIEANTVFKQFATDTRPLVQSASAVVADAREVVAMLRTDAERLTHAAGAISSHLLAAAETTVTRVDDVNAVLDVLQGELEDTALDAAAMVRGVRVSAHALTRRKGSRRRDRSDTP
jgi:hypothetical protein